MANAVVQYNEDANEEAEDVTCCHEADAAAFRLKVELQQRAYIHPSGGGQGRVEWLFVRLHHYLGIAKDPYRMLKDNMPSF